MKPIRTSPEVVALIKKFEGLRLKAYRCPGGVWTIGYGNTDGVTEGMEISLEEAEARLQRDLRRFENAIVKAVIPELTDNQFSALVSLVYNIGVEAFRRSTLLKKFNSGDIQGAAEEFGKWDRVKGNVVPGLAKRRERERGMFSRSQDPDQTEGHGSSSEDL